MASEAENGTETGIGGWNGTRIETETETETGMRPLSIF